jgi:hypothetical protein
LQIYGTYGYRRSACPELGHGRKQLVRKNHLSPGAESPEKGRRSGTDSSMVAARGLKFPHIPDEGRNRM